MKYGHEVPRWWIPEFNSTHKRKRDTENSAPSSRKASESGDELLRTAKLQSTRLQLFEQQRRWAEQRKSEATETRREHETSTTTDKYAQKRRLRQMKQEEQKRLLNRDIRIVQIVLAGVFILIGAGTGSIVGLVFGAAIGLLLMYFRLEL
jgi:hypothetical protein